MIPNFDNKRMRTLEQVEQDQRNLADEIKLIRDQQAKDAEGPWVPYESTNGGLAYTSIGGIGDCDPAYRERGTRFPTQSALDQATPFFNFYHRYFQLAMECNAKFPSDGPRYYVIHRDNKWITSQAGALYSDISILSTSEESAKEMARIMNRDQWVLPTL